MRCKVRAFVLLVAALLLAGCPRGPTTKKSGNNSTSNNNANSSSDNSTTPANCGDGIIDPDETCDPGIAEGEEGACPSSCQATECGTVELVGSASTCDATCQQTPASCGDDDGCCPSGCDGAEDDDCENTCGDGVVEQPEICDGDCPTECPANAICDRTELTGDPADCDARCVTEPITECVSGDGCCPTGCDETDDDCDDCEPITCTDEGVECGPLPDGCGDEFDCGTCSGQEVCREGLCLDTEGIGDACEFDSDCTGDQLCFFEDIIGWPDGYCSEVCSTDTTCGEANHCGSEDGCYLGCLDDVDCRNGYRCHDFDGDGADECAPYGSGSGDVGDACDSYADCGGGLDGRCNVRPNELKDGYCTVDCSGGTACPAGSHCSNGGNICFDNCFDDGDCRGEGYACYDTDGDGQKECFVSATGGGRIGEPCENRWDCGGGPIGGCSREDVDGNWQDGYCFQLCDDDPCPDGAACIETNDGAFCLDDCNGFNDCRTGYDCVDATTMTGGTVSVCIPD